MPSFFERQSTAVLLILVTAFDEARPASKNRSRIVAAQVTRSLPVKVNRLLHDPRNRVYCAVRCHNFPPFVVAVKGEPKKM